MVPPSAARRSTWQLSGSATATVPRLPLRRAWPISSTGSGPPIRLLRAGRTLSTRPTGASRLWSRPATGHSTSARSVFSMTMATWSRSRDTSWLKSAPRHRARRSSW